MSNDRQKDAKSEETIAEIKGAFPAEVVDVERYGNYACVVVRPEGVAEILSFLKSHRELSFDCLTDLLGVDYLNAGKPERFAVIYHLYSFGHNSRVSVKAYISEQRPEIDSVADIWPAANWAEREVYDMYGIVFRNHPNPIRILLPDGYDGFPLRKDYPIHGRGERNDFQVLK